MLFNSLEFALFLPAVFALYWFVFRRSLQGQNVFLLIASYVFYGWWDWRFLSLIVISSLTDYVVGIQLARTRVVSRRKLLLITSLVINLGLLGFFKYFNFFVDSFVDAFSLIGMEFQRRSLNIVLPVGISFYTFQTLSYTIDVYRQKITPTRNIVAFFSFVSFFPQLVAGPIERASTLLPQFEKKRVFNYELAKDGLRQILWGLFKKVVIADTCATYVDQAFGHTSSYPGSFLLLGAIFFAFQIYCDFSGYSDIAIGTARLFGFDLMRNFAYPYFSRDMAEFWRRWHISLTTWFRDYLYIPLGGSRGAKWTTIRNVMIVFVVSGFWHGANWTFIAWGLLNAIYFLPLLVLQGNRRHLDDIPKSRRFPTAFECLQIGSTFSLTLVAWVFFRAGSMSHAFAYLDGMASRSLFSIPSLGLIQLPFIVLIVIWEWVQRDKQHGLQIDGVRPFFRTVTYMTLIYLILANMGAEQPFIYFQF